MSQRFHHLLHLAVNALGLPGVGTWMAGRRVLGGIQIALSLGLMAGTLLGFARLVHLLWLTSTAGAPSAPWALRFLETPAARTALAFSMGCALLYLANLAWSLATARPRHSAPPPLPPSGG